MSSKAQGETASAGRSFDARPWLFAVAAALFSLATGGALLQSPRDQPSQADTGWDGFLRPVERNAWLRLPVIDADLESVFALSDGRHLWAGGNNGVILHSEDGGEHWARAEIGVATPAPADKATPAAPAAGNANAPMAQRPSNEPSRQLKKMDWRRLLPVSNAEAAQPPPDYAQQAVPNATQSAPAPKVAAPSAGTTADQGAANQAANEPTQSVPEAASPTTPAATFSAAIRSIHFINEQTGWAVASNSALLKSTDGGHHWTVSTGSSPPLSAVYFVDEKTGWAVGGDGLVLVTPDGGEHWRGQSSGTSAALNAVHFADGKNGCVAGDSGTLLVTHDGGEHWSDGNRERSAAMHGVFCTDGRNLWAVGDEGSILASSDGGSSWNPQSGGTRASLRSVAFADASNGWIVGLDGTLLATGDGGRHWETLSTGSRAILMAVTTAPQRKAWAVGQAGTVLASSGGSRWRAQMQGLDARLTAVDFATRQTGWIVDANGGVSSTRDGGATWAPQASGVTARLTAVDFIDTRIGWAVGDNGTVIATRDGGEQWSRQDAGTAGSLLALHFIDDRTGWIAGTNGFVAVTHDGGASWQTQKQDLIHWTNSIDFIDARTGWIAGLYGAVAVTHDGGQNWTLQAAPVEHALGNSLNSIRFSSAQAGWAVGTRGIVITTRDGGQNWQAQTIGGAEPLQATDFIDPLTGWAVGRDGGVYLTRDGGLHWTLDTRLAQELTGLHARRGAGAAIVGAMHTVLIRDTRQGSWTSRALPYRRLPAPWCWLLWTLALACALTAAVQDKPAPPIAHSIEDALASDRPLRGGDRDALDAHTLSQALSHFLRNRRTEPPVTIAVTGAWGSGKSSVMNLLERDLQSFGFRPVWFNAWHHQQGEQLLASLFANIREQAIPAFWRLHGLLFYGRLAWRRLRRQWLWFALAGLPLVWFWGYALNHKHAAQGLMAAAQPITDLIQTALEAVDTNLSDDSLGKLQKAIGSFGATIPALVLLRLLRAFGIRPTSLMSGVEQTVGVSTLQLQPAGRYRFAREFREVTEALGLRRMVIFIDDLDRCDKQHVIEVLETINFLASSGDCFIVLGLDERWVRACIKLNYAELAADGDGNADVSKRDQFAENYLEKLINIRVAVPAPPDMVERLLELKSHPAAEPSLWQRASGAARAARPATVVMMMAAIGALLFWLAQRMPDFQRAATPEATQEDYAACVSRVLAAQLHTAEQPAASQADVTCVTHLLMERLGVKAGSGTAPVTAAASNTAGSSGPGAPDRSPDGGERRRAAVLGVGESDAGRGSTSLLAVSFAVLLALAGVVAWLRRASPNTDDSPAFRSALELWLPLIALEHRTPRAIKRFVNRIRFLAMSLRVRSRPAADSADGASGNEATLVALAAVHAMHSDIATSPLPAADSSIPAAGEAESERGRRMALIQRLLKSHRDQFGKDPLQEHEVLSLFRESLSHEVKKK